ncbi:MAG: hypothetical protein AAF962_13790 [Actinomycetota bacterium]
MRELITAWEHWSTSVDGRSTVLRWGADDPALAGWSPTRLRRPIGGAATDRMQAALTARSQAGEDGATLTLIVQFEPALRRLVAARRRRPPAPSVDEATADVVGTFTEVVLTHDLVRRPARIAANLVLDTRQKLDRLDRCLARSLPAPLLEPLAGEAVGRGPLGGARCWTEDPSAADRVGLIVSVADALDALGGDGASRHLTRELAVRAWLLGETSGELAARTGLEPSAVRARLCRLRADVRRRYEGADEAA